MMIMNEGPKLERIPDYNIEPVHFNLDDSKKNKIKATLFSDKAQKKRRKSAFNKHPREYSDVYDISLNNEDSLGKNLQDQIKKQLLGFNKKNSFIDKINPLDNAFGNEKERLQNQLNDIMQLQNTIQSKAERERKYYEDKKKHLQTLIDETNLDDFYEFHGMSLEKKKKIVELESQIQNKEKERLREQKEYYDEIYKAISLKNLLIKEIKEMIDIANKIPSFKEGDKYIDPIKLVKANYLIPDEDQDDIIDDRIAIATEIKKTHIMPSGLSEDNTLSNLQMNATEKYFFDINNNYKDSFQNIERTKAQRKEMLLNSNKQEQHPEQYKHRKSHSQSEIISKKSINKEEIKRETIVLRDIYQDEYKYL